MRPVVLVAIAAAGLGAVWMLVPIRSTAGDGVGPERALAIEPDVVVATPSPRTEPIETPLERTPRDLLGEYWGERWPAMEAALRREGMLDLDAPLKPSELPAPWEDVAVQIGEKLVSSAMEARRGMLLQWPEVTPDFLARTYGAGPDVSPTDVRVVESIATRHNLLLRDRAEVWSRDAEAAFRSSWRRGDFERGPIALPAMFDDPQRKAVTTHSSKYLGWEVQCRLYADEHPGLVEGWDEIQRIKGERDREIKAYFAGR